MVDKEKGTSVRRVVSGGQTGVDRAALDAALETGIPRGGWCPKGRIATDGCIPRQYPLEETPSPEYAQRTEWNVRDSDGTLILHSGPLSGGTAFTIQCARRLGKPVLVIDLDREPSTQEVLRWLTREEVRTLNVAGPRDQGQCEGISVPAKRFLTGLFSQFRPDT